MFKRSLLAFLALSASACGTAHADRIAQQPVLTTAKSPYSVELVSTSGDILDTYKHKGRFYVQGNSGERYSIRVTNPTQRRVEAVVSVDGLDVIDGKTADFRSKRGYIVPAHGNLQIDGFRVSTQAVAAFRFSSVAASYAGRKGKARHVGVVGVAIFAEKAQPVLVVPRPRKRDFRRRPYPTGGLDDSPEAELGASAGEMSPAPAPTARQGHGAVGRIKSHRSRPGRDYDRSKSRERPGLGTKFGERRRSAVNFTRFVRATPNKPTALAELRYNDTQGLQALGIRVRQNLVDEDELAIRESANPFPHSRFAQPPPR